MRSIRWICFFALCWGAAFAASSMKGCANPGADYRSTISTIGPDGKITGIDDVRAGVRFPANLDAMKGFKIGRETVEIGSLSNFRIKAGGWYWMVAGLLLIILGGLLFTGTIPYVSALTGAMPIPGGIVAGVGFLALLWPSIEGAVSVIAVALLALGAVGGVLYALGRCTQAHTTVKRATKAATKLKAEGKPAEATAAMRAASLALDKAMSAASELKAAMTPAAPGPAPAPAPAPTVTLSVPAAPTTSAPTG